MSKLVRVAHCQSESVLTRQPPTHGGDWQCVDGRTGKGRKKQRWRKGGVRETKKLHVSTWRWQLMRCTIIIFSRRSTALWQRAVGNHFSSSALTSICSALCGASCRPGCAQGPHLQKQYFRGRQLRKFSAGLLSSFPQHLCKIGLFSYRPFFVTTEEFLKQRSNLVLAV